MLLFILLSSTIATWISDLEATWSFLLAIVGPVSPALERGLGFAVYLGMQALFGSTDHSQVSRVPRWEERSLVS